VETLNLLGGTLFLSRFSPPLKNAPGTFGLVLAFVLANIMNGADWFSCRRK
jgi:hypothetical protein